MIISNDPPLATEIQNWSEASIQLNLYIITLPKEWLLTVDCKALTACGRVKPIAVIIPTDSSLTSDNPDAPLPGMLNGALKSKKYKMNWGGAQLRISIDLKATKVGQNGQILLRESYMI